MYTFLFDRKSLALLVTGAAAAGVLLFVLGVLVGVQLDLAETGPELAEFRPLSAFEGRAGALLQVFSTEDGSLLKSQSLASLPAFDGMSATAGRLYLATQDGKVVCFGAAGERCAQYTTARVGGAARAVRIGSTHLTRGDSAGASTGTPGASRRKTANVRKLECNSRVRESDVDRSCCGRRQRDRIPREGTWGDRWRCRRVREERRHDACTCADIAAVVLRAIVGERR